MSTHFGPDDEVARRLERALHQEAGGIDIPDRFDEIVAAAGPSRRRPATGLIAAVAAGVVVLALAGGYLAAQGGLRATPAPAGNATPTAGPLPSAGPSPTGEPSPSRTPSAAPSSSPTTTSTTDPLPAARVTGTQLAFASPTGNLVCTMDETNGVRCHAMTATWTGKGVPADRLRGCGKDAGGDFGPGQDVVLTREGSFGSCVTEISVYEAVQTNDGLPNDHGTEYRTWADKDTALVEFLPGMTAYVLPYGTTAVTGRFSCAMAQTGITCDDADSGAGFHLSRADLTLR